MSSMITTSSGVTLTRDSFIAHYVAAFLGSWSSQPKIIGHPFVDAWGFVQPWEKALRCAEAAWEQLENQQP